MRRSPRLGVDSPLEDRLTPSPAGDLDTDFGTNGIVSVPVGLSTSSLFFDTSAARAVAVGPDGRITMAGSAPSPTGTKGTDFGVAHLLPNGTPDPLFGGTGNVTVGFDLGGTNDDAAFAVAVQSDGRILVAGSADNATTGPDFAIARLLPDGTLDATFGTGGKVTIPFDTSGTAGFNQDEAHAIAVQDDGKIVVAGFSRFSFAAARLTAAGKLDTTFGNKGKTTVSFSTTSFGQEQANGIAIQDDGKIVLAGSAVVNDFQSDFAVTRLTASGGLDGTFGNKGLVTVPFDLSGANGDDNDVGNGVALQPDGKIVLVGTVDRAFFGNVSDIGVARLNADGTTDLSFGQAGQTTVGFDRGFNGQDTGNAVVVQPDGKIVVAGSAENSQFTDDFAAARLNPDGTFDTDFGAGGKTTVRVSTFGFFGNTPPGAYAIARQPSDGMLVLAGTNGEEFTAARLLGAPPPVVPPPPVPPEPPTKQPILPVPLSALPPTPAPVLAGGRPDGTAQVLFNRGYGGFFPGATITFFPGVATDVRTAVGDVNGDLIPDFIGGTGAGVPNQVAVIDGKTGATLASFSPFEASFTGGVFVAAADLNGDGSADIVVTPDQGGGPVVAVYDGARLVGALQPETAQMTRFLGIDDKSFRGGARAAVGDVNHDGTPDLVVSAGFLGGPRIAVLDGKGVVSGNPTPAHLVPDFFAFENTVRNGAFVAVGDVNGDGFADLAFGGGPGGGPRVRLIDGQKLLTAGSFSNLDQLTDTARINDFLAGDANDRGGVRVMLRDVDGDGKADLTVGSGQGDAGRVQVFPATGLSRPTPKIAQNVDPFNGDAVPNGAFVG